MPHRPLARIFASDDRLAQWKARHEREAALTQLLRRFLPRPLAERVRVADTRDGVLEIAAGAGAIAAALRQRVPDLRERLAREGFAFDEVRVRVQVLTSANPAPTAARRAWNSADAAPLFELADHLPDGPLRVALVRWSRRARGR
jgi:hypothetical protein